MGLDQVHRPGRIEAFHDNDGRTQGQGVGQAPQAGAMGQRRAHQKYIRPPYAPFHRMDKAVLHHNIGVGDDRPLGPTRGAGSIVDHAFVLAGGDGREAGPIAISLEQHRHFRATGGRAADNDALAADQKIAKFSGPVGMESHDPGITVPAKIAQLMHRQPRGHRHGNGAQGEGGKEQLHELQAIG